MSNNKNPIHQEAMEFGQTFFSVPTALSILQSPTPNELIQKKNQGGTTLDYVSAATVIRTLNKAFGLRWSFRIHDTRVIESADHRNNAQGPVVQTLGELTIPGLGSRMQWGSQSVVGGQQQQEHAFKGSASDSLKKCAAMFLVHLDLADGGPKGNMGLTPADLPAFDLQVNQEEGPTEPQEAPAGEPTQEQPEEINSERGQERVADKQVEVEPEIPQAVQDSIDTLPEEPSNEPQQTPEAPQPVQTQTDTWSEEDVMKLKEYKEKLGIQTNEELNPYIQRFFGNDQMNYRQLTPATIKDFNHFLQGQIQ